MKRYLIFFISIALCFSIGLGKPKDALENALYKYLLSTAIGQSTQNYMAHGGATWGIRGQLDIKALGHIDVENTGYIDILTGGLLKLNGTDITTQLGYLSGVTPGTVTASKFVAVDANKDIAIFRNLSAVGLYAGASGTAGSVRVYPTTASKGYFALSCTDQTGNTAATITADAMGQATTIHWADPGGATSYLMQSTAAITLAEADVLDAVTPGTAAASKAVVLGAAKEISTITTAGITTANIGTGNFSTALNSTAKASIDFDDTTDGVVDVIDLSHTSSDDNATALDGVGISIELENETGTSTVEEWFSLDFKSTTITDGAEDGDIVVNAMLGGTVSPALTVDASDQSVTLGANVTDADGIHQLRIFPVTTATGSLLINSIANGGDFVVTLQNASHGQATVYTLPDIGQATGNIVTLKASQTTAGELKRADLTEDALQVYGIPLYHVRAADGAPMGGSETAGDHYYSFAANVWLLKGESSQNETEVSVSNFEYVIPPEYVAAGDFKIRIKHKVSGTGTLGTCTIDMNAYEQDGNGAVGADLVTTGATATSGTWATTDFVVTSSGFVAGDIINITITSSIEETANVNPLEAHLDGLAILLDIKG